jgi:hypothetical protein
MLVSVFEPLLGAKRVESERIGIGRMRASAVRRYPSNLTFRLKGTAFFAVSVSKRFETRPDIFLFLLRLDYLFLRGHNCFFFFSCGSRRAGLSVF